MLRRGTVRRNAPAPAWAVSPTCPLPESWTQRLGEVARVRSLDSNLWLTREQLWPFFGVANLRHLRNTALPLDSPDRNIVLPVGPCLAPDGGAAAPITPLWSLNPGERKRLLADFPLPSPPYKRRGGGRGANLGSGEDEPPADGGMPGSDDGAAPKADPIAALLQTMPNANSATPLATVLRGPRATPTEMLLLRDGVGWVPMPAELAPLASLIATNPEEHFEWVSDPNGAPVPVGGGGKPPLSKPDCLLFVEGDFAASPVLVPTHVALHNVQELPKTSMTLDVDPSLSHTAVSVVWDPVAGSQVLAKSKYKFSADGELATNAARDQHRCESFRWCFEARVPHIGALRALPSGATASAFSDPNVASGAARVVTQNESVEDMLPLSSLPAGPRKYFARTTPSYAFEASSSRRGPDAIAYVRMHEKYAAAVYPTSLGRGVLDADGAAQQVSNIADVVAATRAAVPADGGLVFIRLRDIKANALVAQDPDMAHTLAAIGRGECPVFRIPCKTRAPMISMDWIAIADTLLPAGERDVPREVGHDGPEAAGTAARGDDASLPPRGGDAGPGSAAGRGRSPPDPALAEPGVDDRVSVPSVAAGADEPDFMEPEMPVAEHAKPPRTAEPAAASVPVPPDVDEGRTPSRDQPPSEPSFFDPSIGIGGPEWAPPAAAAPAAASHDSSQPACATHTASPPEPEPEPEPAAAAAAAAAPTAPSSPHLSEPAMAPPEERRDVASLQRELAALKQQREVDSIAMMPRRAATQHQQSQEYHQHGHQQQQQPRQHHTPPHGHQAPPQHAVPHQETRLPSAHQAQIHRRTAVPPRANQVHAVPPTDRPVPPRVNHQQAQPRHTEEPSFDGDEPSF